VSAAASDGMKVHLHFFKTTGKWYADGEYTSHVHEREHAHMGMLCDEVQAMRTNGCLPGVSGRAADFFIVIQPEDRDEKGWHWTVPHLLPPLVEGR